jgi:hypothetical protein
MTNPLAIALFAAAVTALTAFLLRLGWRAVRNRYARRLSPEEKRLLQHAAMSQGMIHHMEVSQIPGGWVRAGGVDFDTDPRRSALYRAALERLIALGFAEYKSGNLFMSTDAGYKKAGK